MEVSENQQQHLKILNDGLSPFKQRMEAKEDSIIFIQGNVPCHTVKSASRNIAAFLWLPKSSDINTIEN